MFRSKDVMTVSDLWGCDDAIVEKCSGNERDNYMRSILTRDGKHSKTEKYPAFTCELLSWLIKQPSGSS